MGHGCAELGGVMVVKLYSIALLIVTKMAYKLFTSCIAKREGGYFILICKSWFSSKLVPEVQQLWLPWRSELLCYRIYLRTWCLWCMWSSKSSVEINTSTRASETLHLNMRWIWVLPWTSRQRFTCYCPNHIVKQAAGNVQNYLWELS